MMVRSEEDTEILAGSWAWARPRLLERIRRLKTLLTDFAENGLEIRRELHRLAGTLGCFGFPEGSRLARNLEEGLLKGHSIPDLLLTLDKLRTQINENSVLGEVSRARAEVAIFCEPSFPLVDFIALGHSQQVQITPLDDLGDLIGGDWQVVVLDTRHPWAKEFPADLGVPMLGLVDGDDLASRLCAIVAGCQVTCHHDDSPKAIFEVMLKMIEHPHSRPRRILVIDDDPVDLVVLKNFLLKEGHIVETSSNPQEFWQKLEVFAPDLLMLDVTLPQLSGLQLCKMVRADHRWNEIPIVFLSASTDRDTALDGFEAGADDFLTKPLDRTLLLHHLAGHWRRRSFLRQNLLDDLTALPNRKLATRDLDRLLSLARRQNFTLALSLIDLDHFKKVNDRHGHFVGDQVLVKFGQFLRKAYRSEDVVGRWGGEEFLVGQLNCSAEFSKLRLSELLAEFSQLEFSSGMGVFSVSFSAGVTVFPDGGTDISSLYRQADLALYQAKNEGRARVVVADFDPAEEPLGMRSDIMLLEDDDELADMLLRAFRSRGFQAVRYRDGLQALSAWLGEEIARPKILLVDNDLPGVDGMHFLRRLVKDDKLGDTQVITMSAYMEEFEIIESLSMGAWDHVPKPFNLSLLMAKLERMLLTLGQGIKSSYSFTRDR